uniref:Helicase ATP-binding domain-containing protein n=1 Tax=viral metagenome TaxID=1070528 RepID=A0A6C0BX92_9ZZZZ
MEQLLKAFVYIRVNSWFIIENVVKLGITATSLKDRDTPYITGEVERGEYIYVIEIPLNKMKIIDNYLKDYFKSHHIYKGGGTEFYDKCIVDLIEPCLKEINLEYRILTKEEINCMNRFERIRNIPNVTKVKNIFNQIKIENIIQKYKVKRSKKGSTNDEIISDLSCVNNDIEPNEHQKYVLDMIEGFFTSYNIGKIIWACGLGKALLSILIVKLMKFKSVVIGVPGNNLQKQIKDEIIKIFPNKNNILFVGGDEHDCIKSTTNKNKIIEFLNININTQPKFVISTYHSCHLLVDPDIMFEFKIGDEAHHLVGIEREDDKGFRLFHKINFVKSLFMTATEKMIETYINKVLYSMDDETIFGKCIDSKSVNWAIENKKITDYNILVLKNTEDEVDEIVTSLRLNVFNKEIFISCYMCLKSFEKYSDLTHLLLYTNTTEDAELAKEYIDEILKLNILSVSKERIYNNALHSKNCNDLDSEVSKFKNKPYGIISCIYIFGEGFNLPKLNGVCIAGNMRSEIRIAQYLLRPNRLDFENPNKKAYVIIPYIDTDDWENENKSYEKVRTIISHMRNVDEKIEQRIFVAVGNNRKREKPNMIEEIRNDYEDYSFEENSGELNKIKLRLRYSKALCSKFTEEQDEYNYVRCINSKLNIKSKKEYIQQKDIHSNFIASPEEYFKSKGVWNNWYDFMGVDTTKFIESKQDWINFCKEKNIKSLDDYYIYCEDYAILPKEPADFYKDFTNIPSELEFNRNRRR